VKGKESSGVRVCIACRVWSEIRSRLEIASRLRFDLAGRSHLIRSISGSVRVYPVCPLTNPRSTNGKPSRSNKAPQARAGGGAKNQRRVASCRDSCRVACRRRQRQSVSPRSLSRSRHGATSTRTPPLSHTRTSPAAAPPMASATPLSTRPARSGASGHAVGPSAGRTRAAGAVWPRIPATMTTPSAGSAMSWSSSSWRPRAP
jgi:hypothetical protein